MRFAQTHPDATGGTLQTGKMSLQVDSSDDWMCVWGDTRLPTFLVVYERHPNAWHLKQYRDEEAAAEAQMRHPEWSWTRIQYQVALQWIEMEKQEKARWKRT